MKITANRKDDILKRKAQYESDVAAYRSRQADRRSALHKAELAKTEPIRQYLEKKLSRYSALQFDIQCDRAFFSDTGNGVRVWIRCNEHNKFADDSALSWSYDVDLDANGEVKRETSSWSGLSATTEAQMTSLRQTVSALETLNDIDWDELVLVEMPKYSDYFDPDDKEPEREDWDTQLKEAELEEIIGQNKYIKVYSWGESCPYRGKYVWLQIVKETPAMYIAKVVDDWTMQKIQSGSQELKNSLYDYTYRVRKSSIQLANPIEVVDIDNLNFSDTESN